MDNVIKELETLFEEAKTKNEFEFVLTLINFRGMGTHKLMSNLYEWFDAIDFYTRLYRSHTGKEKTRIAALIYSIFFENSDFYNIIGSLCKIRLGYSGSSYLFWKTKKYDRLLGIGEKQEAILELLNDAEKPAIIEFFEQNHYKEIRNTFFHSAYALSEEEYVLHDSDPIVINGIGYQSFEIEEFFYPKVENVIIFFERFKGLYLDSHGVYTEDKKVPGGTGWPTDITILGTQAGLKGFKTNMIKRPHALVADSGIWYNEEYDMFMAYNISIDFQAIESIEIDEQLKRYESKDTIHQSDVEFMNLMEKIKDRGIEKEIGRATALLFKFADVRESMMKQETNEYKRRSYPKHILPFLRKALEIGRLDLKTVVPLREKIANLEKLIS